MHKPIQNVTARHNYMDNAHNTDNYGIFYDAIRLEFNNSAINVKYHSLQ